VKKALWRQAGLVVLLLAASSARAQQQLEQRIEAGAGENRYGKQGAVELGGALSFNWRSNVSSIAISPTVGLFLTDGFEASGIFSVDYINQRTPVGRVGTTVTSLIVEPSYHYSIGKPLFVFAGLGLGAGYDGSQWSFNFVPRAGINILLGHNAVFTPAVLVPVTIGSTTNAALQVQGAFSIVF
jgi:hypothetical protein